MALAFANSPSTLRSKALLPTATTHSINNISSLFFLSSTHLSPLPHRHCHRHRHRHLQLRRHSPAITIRAPSKLILSSVDLQNQCEVMKRRGEEKEMEELVEAIKGGLNSIGAVGVLLEALELVDLIERLGISRFFQEEIKGILKTTFPKWDERYGLGDPATTVLAFRLLRLHGYPISFGAIENLRGEGGEFHSFSTESPEKIAAMMNLHRCWQAGFPSKSKILEEVKEFSTSQLRKVILGGDPSLLKPNNLDREVGMSLSRRFKG